jgi:hypothetical protein
MYFPNLFRIIIVMKIAACLQGMSNINYLSLILVFKLKQSAKTLLLMKSVFLYKTNLFYFLYNHLLFKFIYTINLNIFMYNINFSKKKYCNRILHRNFFYCPSVIRFPPSFEKDYIGIASS